MNKTPEGGQALSGVEEAEQLSLFGPIPFSPIYPKRTSLPGRALALLLDGRELTHPEFETLTGSWRLSEPIRALRHDFGWPVHATEISCPTAERPDRVIARYYLPSRVLQALGVQHG